MGEGVSLEFVIKINRTKIIFWLKSVKLDCNRVVGFEAIALVHVFMKPIVLTTKPRIDAICLLHLKARLCGETVASGKTCRSAITIG